MQSRKEGLFKLEHSVIGIIVFFSLAAGMMAVAGVRGHRLQNPSSLQSGAPWPKFHANDQNTGLSASPGATGSLVFEAIPQQQQFFSNSFAGSPAVGSDGTIYIGDRLGFFYAIDGANGAAKWIDQISATFEGCPAIGSDGTVYIGDAGLDDFHALDASGNDLWTFNTTGPVNGGAAIGADGTIYFGSGANGANNNFYAVNPSSGQQIWTVTSTGRFFGTPAIDAGGNIIEGSDDGNIYSWTAGGHENYRITTGGAVEASAAIENNVVYCPSEDGIMYAFFASSGDFAWTTNVGLPVISSPAIGPDGTVYFGVHGGGVVALDGTTGAKKWVFDPSGTYDSSPAVSSDGIVFIGGANDNFYALDGQTGETIWSLATSTPFANSPAIAADGTVYIPSDRIYAMGKAPLTGFYAKPSTVPGATPTTGVVQIAALFGPAANVTLSGGDANVSYPSVVTVPANKTGATFTINSKEVSVTTSEVLTAKYASTTMHLTLTLEPLVLSKFYAVPSTIIGGNTSHGVVQMNGDAPSGGASIAISSSSTAVSFPASVTVSSGSSGASFSITAPVRNSSISFSMKATFGSSSVTIPMIVIPFNFYASPSTFTGGTSSHGVIQVGGSNTNGQSFNLKSSNPLVSVPSTIEVPAGRSGDSFVIASSPVSADTAVTLTATSGQEVNTANVVLTPYPISNFYVSPSSFTGGGVSFGVVQLAGPAGSSGDVVSISSASALVTVPTTVTVPAGKTGVSFEIRSKAVTAATSVILTATFGASSQQTSVTLNP